MMSFAMPHDSSISSTGGQEKKVLESEGQAMGGTGKAGCNHRLSDRLMLVSIDKSSPTGRRAGSAVKMFSTA